MPAEGRVGLGALNKREVDNTNQRRSNISFAYNIKGPVLTGELKTIDAPATLANFIVTEPSKPLAMASELGEAETGMNDDGDDNDMVDEKSAPATAATTVDMEKVRKRTKKKTNKANGNGAAMSNGNVIPEALQQNKAIKKSQKKATKKKHKLEKAAANAMSD